MLPFWNPQDKSKGKVFKKSIKLQTVSEVSRPPPLRQLQTIFDFCNAFLTLNAVIQYKNAV